MKERDRPKKTAPCGAVNPISWYVASALLPVGTARFSEAIQIRFSQLEALSQALPGSERCHKRSPEMRQRTFLDKSDHQRNAECRIRSQ
jgi:hypothetical protein